MKVISLIILGNLFFFSSLSLKGQGLTWEEVRQQVDDKVDFNEEGLFQDVFHGWWHGCDDEADPELKETLEYCIKNTTDQIENPFWGFSDPCFERQVDILSYFDLLHQSKHKVSEKDFVKLLEVFYLDSYGYYSLELEMTDQEVKAMVNLQHEEGKTPLMYACDYGYKKAIKKIMKNNPDLTLKDKNGKRAADYCEATPKLLKMLK